LDIRSVSFHRAAYKPDDFPRDGRPQIAFVGRSNVGKSTLINTILNRKNIARVSQTPGKTQAIQFYLINEQWYLVDLPGYGYAKVPKSMRNEWGQLIGSYFESTETLRLLVVLLDARRVPPVEQDVQMVEWARSIEADELIVLTKTDKLSNNELAKNRQSILHEIDASPESVIDFSSVTKRGTDKVRSAIYKRL
jgi:GTP-binding protein